MAEELKLVLTLEEKQVLDALAKLTRSADSFNNSASSGFKKSSTAFDVFKGALASQVAFKALGALKNAASDLFDVFITDGLKAAQAQEDAINNLNVALKSSGNFTAQASQNMQDFANEMQATTRIGDETTLEIAALIESLSGLETEGLKKATKAAIDLAATLKIDLNSAATLVGKAASGNVETFSRYGIAIKKGATDSETFANTLAALAKQEGAAEKQTNTFSGAVDRTKNLFSDIQEVTGGYITQNRTVISLVNQLGKEFLALNNSLKSNQSGFDSLVSEGIYAALTAIGTLALGADATARGVKIAFNTITSAARTMAFSVVAPIGLIEQSLIDLVNLIPGAKEKLGLETGKMTKLSSDLVAGIKEDFSDIQDAFIGDTGLSDFAQKIANVQEGIKAASQEEIAQLQEDTSTKNQIRIDGQVALDTALADLAMINSEAEAAREEAALNELKKYYDKRGKLRSGLSSIEKDEATKQLKIVDEAEKKKLQIRTQTFDASASLLNALSGLAATGGAKTFNITKALAMAAIPIDTAAGIMKAHATLPPPASWLQAAAVGVMGATQLIKVASSKPPSFASGGIVPGVPPIGQGDNILANVRSQELILNEAQSGVLANKLNGGGGVQTVIVQVDGREIARAVVEQRKQGFPV